MQLLIVNPIKEAQMSAKKALIFMGVLLILAMGSVALAENPQNTDQTQQQAQRKAANRFQNRVLFVDENGDGICDYGYYLQDGNGKGSKSQKGNRNQNNQNGDQNGSQNKNQNRWSQQSFGDKQNGFGSGLCDGTGSKGQNKGQNKGSGGK